MHPSLCLCYDYELLLNIIYLSNLKNDEKPASYQLIAGKIVGAVILAEPSVEISAVGSDFQFGAAHLRPV